MKVLVGFIFLIIASVFASGKKCFAPVICTEGKTSSPEWMQVFPTLQSASGKTCPKSPSIADQEERKEKLATGSPDKNIRDSFRIETEARLKDMNESYSRLEQQLNSTADELQTGLAECHAKLEQTEKKLVNLLGKCPVKYNGKCFWGIFTGGDTMNQKQASDLCNNEGGNLTGVYSNEHLNQLIMFALPHAAAKSYSIMGLWTGMTYENKTLKQRDGSLAPLLKWTSRHSLQDGSYNKILILVDKERKQEGIWTRTGSEVHYGAFCEIEI